MKASAVAHPIQGLVKYHGLKDFERRIPWHESLSVATAPTKTHTTVEFHDGGRDSVEIDGEVVSGRSEARVLQVVDACRALAKSRRRIRMVSKSNFPKYVGLGSSSSGFAALAVACNEALGLKRSLEEVSEIARLGAGSATRSVTGAFSEWVTEGERSYGRCLAQPGELPWATVAVIVHHDVPTEGVHREAMASPFFRARLDYLPPVIAAAKKAIRDRDSVALMAIAEQDTLNLHAITLTMPHSLLAWRGVTVEAMHAVRAMREREKIPVYFSIDTGAATYVNTLPQHVATVEAGLKKALPGAELMRLEPGPAAHVVPEHLF